jgi:hypothetical protein
LVEQFHDDAGLIRGDGDGWFVNLPDQHPVEEAKVVVVQQVPSVEQVGGLQFERFYGVVGSGNREVDVVLRVPVTWLVVEFFRVVSASHLH